MANVTTSAKSNSPLLALASAEDRSPLRGVGVSRLTRSLVEFIVLRFERQSVKISSTAETDEIEAILVGNDDGCEAGSEASMFGAALGKPIFDVWYGVNHQGYQDMVQLRFGWTVNEPHVCVQIQAEATGLSIFAVTHLERL